MGDQDVFSAEFNNVVNQHQLSYRSESFSRLLLRSMKAFLSVTSSNFGYVLGSHMVTEIHKISQIRDWIRDIESRLTCGSIDFARELFTFISPYADNKGLSAPWLYSSKNCTWTQLRSLLSGRKSVSKQSVMKVINNLSDDLELALDAGHDLKVFPGQVLLVFWPHKTSKPVFVSCQEKLFSDSRLSYPMTICQWCLRSSSSSVIVPISYQIIKIPVGVIGTLSDAHSFSSSVFQNIFLLDELALYTYIMDAV